ncbi:MAG TPA: hypothetical protein VKB80_05300 [Kofleriaceae bacterium]|nr:hypothetical protein [Kofleriaceae bacterium]
MRAVPGAGLLPPLVAGLLLAALPRAAAADGDPPFTIGPRPAWFLLGGVTGGATLAESEGGGGGGFVGGELSLVRLRDGRFAGLYADGYRDFGGDATYLSAGPELGVHLRSAKGMQLSFGADAGLALRVADDSDAGAAGRLSVTLFGLFSIYGRAIYLAADRDDMVVQAGAMLKFPLASPFGG